ncbi:MAG TPA: hypothetical protein VGF01_18290 [Terracidiphilus sp.]
MRDSSTISLFSEQHEQNRRPLSILFSVVAHIVIVGLIVLGILTAPKIKPTKIAERYVVRHLDLESLDSEVQRAREEVKPPRSHTPVHAASIAPKSEEVPPAPLRMALQAPQGAQTLVQPDLPKPVALKVEIPVPTVVIWSGKPAPVKKVIAPTPAPPPMVTNFKPSVLRPNDEPNLTEVPLAPSALAVHSKPMLTGTTMPIVVSGPKPTPPAPLTTAKGAAAQPTPTAILSLSDHQMAKGPINLPPVNSSAIKPSQGMVAAIKPQEQAGHGSPTNQASEKTDGKAGAQSDAGRSSQSAKTGNPQAAAEQKGVGIESYAHAAHMVRPKEGQFGSVVVGSAVVDKFPEMAGLLSGKMSYSVYVPVGLPKNWILEYSLPRSGETASAGNVARLEAPWPFNIVRPNIAPGSIDADALMIHGYVNLEGRFEALTVAFPPQFEQTQFVLSMLNQWQFRPATQNGQNVKVEVLLIIPEIEE